MFTVVQDTDPIQSTTWFVLDDHGEERFAHSLLVSAVRFAARLITEEQDYERRKQEATFEEAPSFVSESYRRGQAQAYAHAQTRLSFLLGGTLPRGGAAFRQQLAELSSYLERAAASAASLADLTKSDREGRISAKLDA